jgi:hypothetical protein
LVGARLPSKPGSSQILGISFRQHGRVSTLPVFHVHVRL